MSPEMSNALIQFLPFVFFVVISIIPSIKLLRRTGMQPVLAILNLIPLFGAVLIVWIVAYSHWPKIQDR